MRIDDRPDAFGGRCRSPHRIEHLLRDLQVEERVDEERLVTIDDQPGVAPAPRARQLRVRENAVPEIVQCLFHGNAHAAIISELAPFEKSHRPKA